MMRHKVNPRPRVCKRCGEAFLPCHHATLYCSRACANKARYSYMRGYNVSDGEDARLKKTYGIGLNEYNEMLKNQNGVCAICGKQSKTGGSKLHVDHNHATGAVRGLLCYNCNASLALVENHGIEKITEYINRELYKGVANTQGDTL